MRLGLALLISLWLTPSFACTLIIAQPDWVTFDAALARPGDRPPDAPKVTIESIIRGNDDGPCSGGAAVVLSIPATAESRELAYSFEVVAGVAEDVIFEPGPRQGTEREGKLVFYLDWRDGASVEQEPLDLLVLVTPFRRSGLAGRPVSIRVVDGGR